MYTNNKCIQITKEANFCYSIGHSKQTGMTRHIYSLKNQMNIYSLKNQMNLKITLIFLNYNSIGKYTVNAHLKV